MRDLRSNGDLAGEIARCVLGVPGVRSARFLDERAEGAPRGIFGWIALERAARATLERRLVEKLGGGEFCQAFFFGRFKGKDVSALLHECDARAELPPGFAPVEFLSDASEAALRAAAQSQLTEIDQRLSAAKNKLAAGTAAQAAECLRSAARDLSWLLSCLYWRRFDLSPRMLPSGPFRALQREIETLATDLPGAIAAVDRTLRAAKELVRAQHGPIEKPSPSSGGTGANVACPIWYGEAIAENYDRFRHFPRDIGPQVASLLDAYGCTNVIELGAGTGRFTLSLLEAGAGQHFTVLDQSCAMLARFQQKMSPDFRERVTVCNARIDQVHSHRGRFDAIIEHEAFFTQPNPTRLARTLTQALNPGGVLLRLERRIEENCASRDLTDLFDREIAARTGSPIGFVGEGIAEQLDDGLSTLGFQTTRRTLVRAERKLGRDRLLEALGRRAFPYLEHVPPHVLEAALAVARRVKCPNEIPLVERYDLAVSMSEEALADRLAPMRRTRPQV